MDEEQQLTDRLRELGRQPLDPDVRAETLARMATADVGPTDAASPVRARRWSRPAVAAAALVASLFGGLGLASAGALPAGVQDKAESLLDHVGIDVPPGHMRYHDPAACPGGPYKNHGEYVRAHKDDPNAGPSPCGKPLHSLNHSSESSDSDDGPGASDTESGGHAGHGKDHGAKKGNEDSDSSDQATTPSTASPDATTTPETTSTTAPTTTTTAAESSSSGS